MKQVLLVDDDVAVRNAVAQTLELADFDVITAGSFVEAKDQITKNFAGIILSDIRMPGRDGFHLLDYAKSVDPELPVVFLSGEGDIPMAVRAVGIGAFDFLEKPCGPVEMIAVLQRAIDARSVVLDNRAMMHKIQTADPAARLIFGVSEASEQLRKNIRSVAGVETEVLITGAPGTGISKVAEVLHLSSPRSKGAFQKRASEHLTRDALDDVLAQCENGGVFFDAIEQMPRDTQLRLLDHMETGGRMPRIIAGTNMNVADLDQSQTMVPDLYYRLSALSIRIPSLAERPEDIPVMFRHYVAQAAEQSGKPVPEIGPDVIGSLMAREWSGNARSLMSVAMKFVLGISDFVQTDIDETLGLAQQMAQVEKALIMDALRKSNGRVAEAIKILKLPRKTFYDKLNKHGIRAEMFR